MTQLISRSWRLITVGYRPNPEVRSFADRVRSQSKAGLTVEAAALSAHESQQFFGEGTHQ